MNRAEFVAAVAAATAAPSPRSTRLPAIVAEVTRCSAMPTRCSLRFVVAIALNNTTGNAVRLDFPTADLFRIDVIRDDTPVWSSLSQHKPIPVDRQLDVPPGRTKLASMTIDGTTDDRRAYAPGKYIVRVAMLGTSFGMIVDKPVTFAQPATVADLLRTKPGTVVTVAGDQISFGGGVYLRDASGSVHLSRSLGLRPVGTYIVRGFLDASGDDRVLDVGRFAPAFDNPPTTSQ